MIIGLIGAAGAGKSTAAKILVEQHGFTRVRMAEVLKGMLRTAGLTDDEIDGSLKMAPSTLLGGKTPRWAMQSLGTEWGRDCIDNDFWVRAMEARLDQLPAGTNVVIDDVRFANELDMVTRRGGTSVTIRRAAAEPDLSWRARMAFRVGRPQWSGLHASEVFWRLANTDFVVHNDGSVEDLEDDLSWTIIEPVSLAA